jgi:SAM-dependent methyltransferase
MAFTPEYVTDVTYVRSFEPDLSPARLRLITALNGFAPPPAHEFDYCELGCAHGDTTAALAAAYPRARFFGIDLNQNHISAARSLARGGALPNVQFLQEDFGELDKVDLPGFDFLTAHGVLSWIGPSKRKALLDFARKKLKPGGLFYVSYNAFPGWAAVEPLRQLLVGRASLAAGDTLERARQAVDFAKQLLAGGAEYFKQNPGAKAMLSAMEKHGLEYVVHEYMHAHWVPMYFAQVASEMAENDLYFVGQAPPYMNYRDLAVPAPLAAIFQSIGDRVAFESLKDFATNEYFRKDIYIRGRAVCSPDATRAYFDTTNFGTLVGEGKLARSVELPHHTLHYSGEIFDVLLPSLEQGAKTAVALSSRPQLAGFGVTRIRDAILRLALGGQVTPMQGETRRASQPPSDATLTIPSAYNRWVLTEAIHRETSAFVSAPLAGTAIEIPLVEALAMVLLTQVDPAERLTWLREQCTRKTFRLYLSEVQIEVPEERARILAGEIERLRTERVPKMLELGILATREGSESTSTSLD